MGQRSVSSGRMGKAEGKRKQLSRALSTTGHARPIQDMVYRVYLIERSPVLCVSCNPLPGCSPTHEHGQVLLLTRQSWGDHWHFAPQRESESFWHVEPVWKGAGHDCASPKRHWCKSWCASQWSSGHRLYMELWDASLQMDISTNFARRPWQRLDWRSVAQTPCCDCHCRNQPLPIQVFTICVIVFLISDESATKHLICWCNGEPSWHTLQVGSWLGHSTR